VADYTPIHTGGSVPFTSQASAAVTGGQVVMASGAGTVAAATQAGEIAAVGVAGHDAAIGAKVTVWPLPGVTHEVTAQGVIAAGANVRVGTVNGTVATIGAGTFALGVALSGAADTALCRFIGR
jgi:Uncharacterized conserved protein (DUF2190)